MFLNTTIVLLLLLVGYLSYAFISRNFISASKEARVPPSKPQRAIQLDVLNGCGVKGVGARFTKSLRAAGFDVVEVKNFKSFHEPKTLVIDRVGNLDAAHRVAAALGIADSNIVQQINPDYFVDVTVLVGGDYSNIRLTQ